MSGSSMKVNVKYCGSDGIIPNNSTSFPEKIPEVPTGQQANAFQQCALAVMKENHILGCINKNVLDRVREVIYTVLRPHRKYHPHFGLPSAQKTLTYWSEFRERPQKRGEEKWV